MHHPALALSASVALLLSLCVTPARASDMELAAFDYTTTTAAQASWVRGYASLPVELGSGGAGEGALRFPAPMDTLTQWRIYWDHTQDLNLTSYDRVEITIRATHPEAISSIGLQLESGAGWYSLGAFTPSASWTTISVPLVSTWTEGTPAGWNVIRRIRMSAQPGVKVAGDFTISHMRFRGGFGVTDIGVVGAFGSTAEAIDSLEARAARLSRPDAEARLDSLKSLIARLEGKSDLSAYADQADILWGQRLVGESWALLQETQPTELRGLWCHYGNGISMGNRTAGWNELMPKLDSVGFNAFFPNMLWSGVAFYPSTIVPQHSSVVAGTDHMADLVRLGDSLGIGIHVWKVMFQFAEGWLAPAGTSALWRAAGKMQINSAGDTTAWLSPCDSSVVEYEITPLEEVARNYPNIKGVHLDYIRFDGTNVDYSPLCKEKFERRAGVTLASWPADVISGAYRTQYAEFRRHLIDTLVQQVHTRIQAIDPNLQVSAAVFSDPASANASVMQNWPLWIQNGWVDFVAPMNYTSSMSLFESRLDLELAAAQGTSVKVYPGIGAFDKMQLGTLVDQIRLTREKNTGGYVIFDLNADLLKYNFPYIGAGLNGQPAQTYTNAENWYSNQFPVVVGIDPRGALDPRASLLSQGLSWKREGDALRLLNLPELGTQGVVKLVDLQGRELSRYEWSGASTQGLLTAPAARGPVLLHWSSGARQGSEAISR